MNTVAKGKRHVAKIIKWLRQQGYDADSCEYRTKWATYDLFGADIVFKDESDIGFIQAKANRGHVAQGIRELRKGKWPKWVRRLVVHWPARGKAPEVWDASKCD